MPRWYGQRGRRHAIIGDASLMAAHAGHPPSRGRLRRGSCYESQKPRLVQKGWDMLLQHAMRFRRCQWVSCGRRAARDSPTPSTRQGTLRLGAADPAGFYLKRFSPPAGYGLLLFFLLYAIYPLVLSINSPEPHRVLTKVTNAAPRSPFGGDERS